MSPYDGRPLVGKISINPEKIVEFGENLLTDHTFYYSILQSTFQVMAFTKDHLSYWLKPGGGNYPESEIYDIDEKSRGYIIGSEFLEQVKLHFNCPTIDKFYIEDGLTPDTANPQIYWESRYLFTDIMIANFTNNPKVSDITTKFMEQTGWYTIHEA